MAVVDSTSQGVTGIKRERVWDSAWFNTKFILGSSMIILIILFGLLGPYFWDTELAYTASSPINLPPMWQEGGTPEHPFGTESNGRDMLASLIVGTPSSLKVGIIAASIGMGVGLILGSLAGYLGGWPDHVIRTISDSFITIPSLLVLDCPRHLCSYARHNRHGTDFGFICLARPNPAGPFPGTHTARAWLCEDGAAFECIFY